MQQSHVISVAGRFVGAAIREQGRYRFHAVDPRAEELDGSTWLSLPDVQRVANHLLSTGRLPLAVAAQADGGQQAVGRQDGPGRP